VTLSDLMAVIASYFIQYTTAFGHNCVKLNPCILATKM